MLTSLMNLDELNKYSAELDGTFYFVHYFFKLIKLFFSSIHNFRGLDEIFDEVNTYHSVPKKKHLKYYIVYKLLNWC